MRKEGRESVGERGVSRRLVAITISSEDSARIENKRDLWKEKKKRRVKIGGASLTKKRGKWRLNGAVTSLEKIRNSFCLSNGFSSRLVAFLRWSAWLKTWNSVGWKLYRGDFSVVSLCDKFESFVDFSNWIFSPFFLSRLHSYIHSLYFNSNKAVFFFLLKKRSEQSILSFSCNCWISGIYLDIFESETTLFYVERVL